MVSSHPPGFMPLLDTPEIVEARGKLYRFWKANKWKAGDQRSQQSMAEELLSLATSAALAELLVEKGIVSVQEWHQTRSEWFMTFAKNHIERRSGEDGWKRPE